MDVEYRTGIHHQNANGLSRHVGKLWKQILTQQQRSKVFPKQLEKLDNLSLELFSPLGVGDVQGSTFNMAKPGPEHRIVYCHFIF